MVADLTRRFLTFDEVEVAAIQGRRTHLTAALRLLGHRRDPAALSRLLQGLRVSRDDPEMLHLVVRNGLGGDPERVHRWLVEYDVVAQRDRIIRETVLPFAHRRGWALFAELKRLEHSSIVSGVPLRSADLHGAVLEPSPDAGGSPLPLWPEPIGTVRFVLPDPALRCALHLARTMPDLLREIAARTAPSAFLDACAELAPTVPTYAVTTHLGYPMGGGESYMHQTCRVLAEFGIACVWVSMYDALAGEHAQDKEILTPYYLDVRLAGGAPNALVRFAEAMERFRPTLVHTHGGSNAAMIDIAEEQRLTLLVGQHFWNGLVHLGPSGNRNMLGRIREHRPEATRLAKLPPGLARRYVASEFMQEVYCRVGGAEKLTVLHPLSDTSQFMVEGPREDRYVLCLNVSYLKGGAIFLDCVRALGDRVPFMGVISEPGDAAFMEELRAQCAGHPNCTLAEYGNVRDRYATARLLLVPTLVDETFCRVAYEAAMNGIPVVSTRNGFLPCLLGETGVFLPEDPQEWIRAVAELYEDRERLADIGRRQKAFVEAKFGGSADAFLEIAFDMIENSTARNIGLFTIWGDQGLGNLMRHRAQLLRRAGWRVHVFAFRGYASAGQPLVNQAEPGDWAPPEHVDSVYYSYNIREDVPIGELRQFVLANRLRKLVVPEICWMPNWRRLLELDVPGLSVIAEPMIETVLEKEVALHGRLSATLFNTHQCEAVLTARGVTNGRYIGHGFGEPLPAPQVAARRAVLRARGRIRFLHVGGHNPTTRKNTPRVLEAFIEAARQRDDLELTVTSMADISALVYGDVPDCVTVIGSALPHQDILNLYAEHDVSIQVSSHEGLGLGFYESIAHGVPVLSLDAPPHNEAVEHGVTGWLIPARAVPLPDNDSGIVPAWEFEVHDLATAIAALDCGVVEQMIERTASAHARRLDNVSFLRRLLPALGS